VPAHEVVVAPPPGVPLVGDGRGTEGVAIPGDDHLGRDAEGLGRFEGEDVRTRGSAADDRARSQPRQNLSDLPADELGVGLGELVGARTATGVEDDHLISPRSVSSNPNRRHPVPSLNCVLLEQMMVVSDCEGDPPCMVRFVER
jgi:hypothetical protein